MSNESSIQDFFQRHFSTDSAASEEMVPEDSFPTILEQIKLADFSDLERSGCVSVTNYPSNTKIPLILFLPKLGINSLSINESKTNSDSRIIHKILLYFIKCTHEVMLSGRYVLVYGHTPLGILSQQPVIYKYYKLLPRPYKKNLQDLIIIHPQLGIKVLFEVSKVFLSEKFYKKLILVNSISEVQAMISSNDLILPHKYIKLEDDEFGFKYNGSIPSLMETYVPVLGTTKLLCDCMNYLRYNGGFQHIGIFRIPGDENTLTLAKIRMQKIASTCLPGTPIVHDKIVIGYEDEDDTSDHMSVSSDNAIDNKSESKSQTSSSKPSRNFMRFPESIIGTKTAITKGFTGLFSTLKTPLSSSANLAESFPSPSSSSGDKLDSPKRLQSPIHQVTNNPNQFSGSGSISDRIATVSFTDIDTVAQILKFSLRELPEPLITFDTFEVLFDITKRLKLGLPTYEQDQWEIDVSKAINSMPEEHKSTLNHLLYFLAEVGAHSSVNNMDINNLATIFSPTIMRSRESKDEPAKFLAEIGIATIILVHLLSKQSLSVETQQRRRSISDNSIASFHTANTGSHFSGRFDGFQLDISSTIYRQVSNTSDYYRNRHGKSARFSISKVSSDVTSVDDQTVSSGTASFLSTLPRARGSINLRKHDSASLSTISSISNGNESSVLDDLALRESLYGMEISTRPSEMSETSNASKLEEMNSSELSEALDHIESTLGQGIIDRFERGAAGRRKQKLNSIV